MLDLAPSDREDIPPHGDLTPSNILDGGNHRGLVAIDPAPSLGDDLAFEAIDLLLWQADDVDMIGARAEVLAPAIDVNASASSIGAPRSAAMTNWSWPKHLAARAGASKLS